MHLSWKEIKQRKVVQVTAAYAVVAWILIQIVDVVSEPLALPDWFDTVAILLLMLGLPIAIVLSWIFDLTPSGIVRTGAVQAPVDSALDHEPNEKPSSTPAAAAPRDRVRVLRNSVAVLPLENMSPNPDDAYFAAGIHEEILNYLAKIDDLAVIARTSVRKYADTDMSIAEIAADLGVEMVMEGSVRYAGDRVRVTAQLIDAKTAKHLWSEVYERELANVFSIQADIAMRIAEATHSKVVSGNKNMFDVLPRTQSSEAHALFLKSQALFGQGETAMAVTALPSLRAEIHTKLDQAIRIDPDFSAPYAFKALLYAVSRLYEPGEQKDWIEYNASMEQAVLDNAGRALALNSEISKPHLALALNHQFSWRGAQSREAYRRALELQPNDAVTLSWYSNLNWFTRRYSEAIEFGEKAAALDPGNALAHIFLGCCLHAAGEHEAACTAFHRANAIHPHAPLPYLLRAMPASALGNESAALNDLQVAAQLMPDEAGVPIHLHLAYGFARLGEPERAAQLVERVRTSAGDKVVDPCVWVLAELALQDTEGVRKWIKLAVESPEYRQEVFVRTLIGENCWFDPILDSPEMVALRKGLEFSE